MLYRKVEQMAYSAFSILDLAPSHAFILMVLEERVPEVTIPRELAEILGLDKSTIARLLNYLEAKELVIREPRGRITEVKISRKGKQLLPRVEQCWRHLYEQYCDLWGKESSDNLSSAISRFLLEVSKMNSS